MKDIFRSNGIEQDDEGCYVYYDDAMEIIKDVLQALNDMRDVFVPNDPEYWVVQNADRLLTKYKDYLK